MATKIIDRQKRIAIDRRLVRRLVKRILEDHDRTGADLTIVFAPDDLVRELNLSYRMIDRPTDVLAFAMEEGDAPGDAPGDASGDTAGAASGADPEEPEPILGDVIVSTDRAAVQARRYRRTAEHEVAKLVAHGVLHLLGHDHEKAADLAAMRKLENRYVREFLHREPQSKATRRAAR
jgi:probable rRNA maturation factor